MSATPEETGVVAEAAVVPPAKAGPPPMSAKDWAHARRLWEQGNVTYKDLSAKYGRSYKSFERHFKKHGCIKGAKRALMKRRVEEALEREEINDAQLLANRVRETKEEHYKMASALGRLTWNEVIQAKKDGRAIATTLPNLKALNAAIVNLKVVREERFAVLGLDRADSVDLDQIPELVIKELTAEQIEALRKRDHTEADEGPPAVPATDTDLPEDDDGPEPDDDDDVVIEE